MMTARLLVIKHQDRDRRFHFHRKLGGSGGIKLRPVLDASHQDQEVVQFSQNHLPSKSEQTTIVMGQNGARVQHVAEPVSERST